MKKLLTVLILLAVVIGGLWLSFFRSKKDPDSGPRQQPLSVSKHSTIFNESAERMIAAYYDLAEGFVVSDTQAVGKHGRDLKISLDSLRVDQLQKDTVIFQTATSVLGNAKAEIDGLLRDSTLEEKRLALNSLTQYLYDLLRTVRYDQSKIYFQECPMAFGEDQPGNWLSKTPAIRNPYQGGDHIKQKERMQTCGGAKDTLNFLAADTTK